MPDGVKEATMSNLKPTAKTLPKHNLDGLGKLIRAERLKAGLKPFDLAYRAGITAMTLSKIEAGDGCARYCTILDICKILNIQVNVGKHKAV